MSEDTLSRRGLSATMMTVIAIGIIALACIAGLAATVIVVAGEIPWHHILPGGCG